MPLPLHRTVSPAGATVEILPANPRRTYAIISNDSAATAYLKLGAPAGANDGIRLNASGGWYEITSINMWRGTVYVYGNGVINAHDLSGES